MRRLNALRALTLTIALAAGTLVAAGPAGAEDVYPDADYSGSNWRDAKDTSRTGQLGDEGVLLLTTDYNFIGAEPNTTVSVAITSCGRYAGTFTGTGSGSFSVRSRIASRKAAPLYEMTGPYLEDLGPTVDLTFTYDAPGKATWTNTLTQTTQFHCGHQDRDKSSGTGTKAVPASWVTKWPTKAKSHKTAKVGKTVKASKAKLSSAGKRATVRYRWSVGGKTVKTTSKPTLKVKRAYKGKTLKLKTIVSRNGYKPRAKTLSFGKVR